MFVALEAVRHKGKGIFDRFINILTRPKASIEEAEALGARYGLLRAPVFDGAPDWDEVRGLVGRFAGKMLLPDDIRSPEGITEVKWPRTEKEMLETTACELIRRTRMPMYRRALGLIDPECDFADMMYGLLKHYTAIRVVTNRPEQYQSAADDMMERLGAPVLVGSSISMLADCVLILAPSSSFGENGGRYPCPVLAGGGFHPQGACELINGLMAPVLPEIREACPEGISHHRFAAALYEHCGLKPESHVASGLLIGGRQTSLEEAVKLVTQMSDRYIGSLF